MDAVFHGFSAIAPQVVGVLGNHYELGKPRQLPRNVHVLDGQIKTVGSLRVGGVSGIIGNPGRHQRRTAHFIRFRDLQKSEDNLSDGTTSA